MGGPHTIYLYNNNNCIFIYKHRLLLFTQIIIYLHFINISCTGCIYGCRHVPMEIKVQILIWSFFFSLSFSIYTIVDILVKNMNWFIRNRWHQIDISRNIYINKQTILIICVHIFNVNIQYVLYNLIYLYLCKTYFLSINLLILCYEIYLYIYYIPAT